MQSWLRQNQKVLFSAGTAVFTFLVYALTLAPDLTWQAGSGDGGELITAAVTLGIPHPPGYPTYVLLGKLTSLLPFEPIACRFHLFSALCAAIASGLLTAATKKIAAKSEFSISSPLSIIPGLVFAFSPLVWDQAVVAEVYTLNLLIIAAFLWALLGERPSFIIGLFWGLSLTTHLTSLFLLPLALVFTAPKTWGKLVAGALLGASPYLLLPILAQQGSPSPVLWGNPTTVEGWWWLVSGQIYQANQFSLPLSKFWPRSTVWVDTFAQQLAIFGWLLLLLSGWIVRYDHSTVLKKWWGLAVTGIFYLIYALFYNTQDAIVLTLPAWLVFSLCLTPALSKLGNRSFILPVMALLLHLLSHNGANNHNIRQQAEQVLKPAPSGALLLTSGDPDIFALWYFHHVEGQRPDIILVDDNLFAFDWYRHNLKRQYPTLRALEKDNLTLFVTANKQQMAICMVHFSPEPNGNAVIDCLQDSIE